MIKETVDESLGKKKKETKKTAVEIKINAFIGDDYVADEAVKFALYRKISDIMSAEDADDIRDEMRDRFGNIPTECENLIRISYARAIAGEAGVSVIREEKGNIVLLFPNPDLSCVSRGTEKLRDKCIITAGTSFAAVLKTKGLVDAEKLNILLLFLESLKKQ